MNDIDIEEGRRYQRAWSLAFLDRAGTEAAATIRLLTAEIERLRNNAAAMFDAIETGRQWETIARRLADAVEALLEPDDGQPEGMDLHGHLVYAHPEWEAKDALAAFRDVADRTPDPTTHHDGGAG